MTYQPRHAFENWHELFVQNGSHAAAKSARALLEGELRNLTYCELTHRYRPAVGNHAAPDNFQGRFRMQDYYRVLDREQGARYVRWTGRPTPVRTAELPA